MRMKSVLLPRTALTWAPEGNRKRSHPFRETWKTVERERCEMRFRTWSDLEAETIAMSSSKEMERHNK